MKPFPTIDRLCIVDGQHGIYVPYRFAVLSSADDMLTEEQREILMEGPDHPEYWDVWDEIVGHVVVKRGDSYWRLEQDEGDVFLVKLDGV